MKTTQDKHYIEIVDEKGLEPIKMLGPYSCESLADRAHRGVMRQINGDRYTAAVVSEDKLHERAAKKAKNGSEG